MPLSALGLMRLSTAPDRDDERGVAVIHAALQAGVRLFDTAPSYAQGEADLHHNERLLGRAIRASGVAREEVRIVTKVGLTRIGSKWIPDGRAASIRASAQASLQALDLGPIDLLLLHCVDPAVALDVSVRALDGLRQAGITRAIGLSGVGHDAFARALELTTIEALQLRLGAFEDRPLRTGLVELARSQGALILAHTPLGGPAGAARIARNRVLQALAARHEATPAELVLAWIASRGALPLPGATRPETAVLAARAAMLANQLDPETLDAIGHAIGARPRAQIAAPAREGEVVLVMGIQGAGKSRCVSALPDHERLNRDLLGGTLKQLHRALERRLIEGAARLVLDNTYATRASRVDAIELARAHGLPVRCLFLDTPLHEAQVNVVLRMLARHGELLAGDALREAAKRDPGVFMPTIQHRYLRELEPPSSEEGFASVERVAFAREPLVGGRPGRVVALELVTSGKLVASDIPTLAIAWAPEPQSMPVPITPGITLGLCTHPAGPPSCWCRPPLPGLIVRWLLAEGVEPAHCTFIGTSRTHRSMADAFGMRWDASVA